MQVRHLMAKVRRGEPSLLPNGLRVITLMPEWGSGLPLWESFTAAYRLTGADRGLSADLSRDLYDWNEQWQARGETDPLAAGWLAKGPGLHARLQRELDGIAEVRPEYGSE